MINLLSGDELQVISNFLEVADEFPICKMGHAGIIWTGDDARQRYIQLPVNLECCLLLSE